MAAVQSKASVVLLKNRKVYHEYTVEDSVEAGIVLHGSEVKAIRAGHAQLVDAYAAPHGGEMFLHHMNISAYRFANQFNHVEQRQRKLLLHKRQIQRFSEAVRTKGYTLLPLEVYTVDGKIKVLLGLCIGKKQYDKRRDQREKDLEREYQQTKRH